MATSYRLKRKCYGLLGSLTGLSNISKAANLASTGAAGVGKQLAIGGAKMGAIGATAYGGKQVFDKLTGEN